MLDELYLEVPNITHKEQAIELIEQVDKTDVDPHIRFSGFNDLEKYKYNYEEWLKYIALQLDEKTVPEGLVCASTYFCVRRKDNKIVGIINIRHELNDYLLSYGGHIGYSIKPDERHKQYAPRQLKLALEKCKELGITNVLVTCVEYNVPSARTIERCGGILENMIYNPHKGVNEKRYWIENN